MVEAIEELKLPIEEPELSYFAWCLLIEEPNLSYVADKQELINS